MSLELQLLKHLLIAAVLAGVGTYLVASLVKFLFMREPKFKDYGDWD